MPLQNRVTPFGDIVAISQRGMFTGNSGIIHDPATRTLLKRRWSGKAWLVCLCEFKGRRRDVMRRRSWTELFFLDEAVALAAGHRPCFYCRRSAAQSFRAAWAEGRGVALPRVEDVLAALADIGEQAPFRQMTTPWGAVMSVAMTNCGEAGWLTDPTGYRYDRLDPQTGQPWPGMPDCFRQLAISAAAKAG